LVVGGEFLDRGANFLKLFVRKSRGGDGVQQLDVEASRSRQARTQPLAPVIRLQRRKPPSRAKRKR